jgi:hypothetical protein
MFHVVLNPRESSARCWPAGFAQEKLVISHFSLSDVILDGKTAQEASVTTF